MHRVFEAGGERERQGWVSAEVEVGGVVAVGTDDVGEDVRSAGVLPLRFFAVLANAQQFHQVSTQFADLVDHHVVKPENVAHCLYELQGRDLSFEGGGVTWESIE